MNEEQKIKEMMYLAIGWAYADCCVDLDNSKDPRKTNMGDVIKVDDMPDEILTILRNTASVAGIPSVEFGSFN